MSIQKDEEFHRKMTAMTTSMTDRGCLEMITPKHARTRRALLESLLKTGTLCVQMESLYMKLFITG